MTCKLDGASAQKRQNGSERGEVSGTSSPVMTQERVMGSLRSSMLLEEHRYALLVNRSRDGWPDSGSWLCYNPRTHHCR